MPFCYRYEFLMFSSYCWLYPGPFLSLIVPLLFWHSCFKRHVSFECQWSTGAFGWRFPKMGVPESSKIGLYALWKWVCYFLYHSVGCLGGKMYRPSRDWELGHRGWWLDAKAFRKCSPIATINSNFILVLRNNPLELASCVPWKLHIIYTVLEKHVFGIFLGVTISGMGTYLHIIRALVHIFSK